MKKETLLYDMLYINLRDGKIKDNGLIANLPVLDFRKKGLKLPNFLYAKDIISNFNEYELSEYLNILNDMFEEHTNKNNFQNCLEIAGVYNYTAKKLNSGNY